MTKDFYIGWQTGITYESTDKRGVSFSKMLKLLDEMAENDMNMLSLMMVSYSCFDPMHDGLCWPVKNTRLEHLRDEVCTNASKETEFVSKIIEEAEKRGIGIQLFTNLGIYNPKKIIKSYPKANEQINKDGDIYKWLFCPDSPGAWQLELDEISDLLKLYNHENVKSIGYERLSYAGGSCFCDYSKFLFNQDTGLNLSDYTRGDKVFENWKVENITDKLKTMNDYIRSINQDIEICLHTSLAKGWGHEVSKLKDAGVDCVMPHIAHFPMSQLEFNNLLDNIYPNDIILQVCVRNKSLSNYDIWIKTPEIIQNIGSWIREYKEDHSNLKGVVFFNENTVSDESRRAVNQLISDF
jgi:hypothetical protein